jgi:hypothetical protein
MSEEAAVEGHRKEVHFTVDGEPFETRDPEQRAREILKKYAKVDPEHYELGELEHHDPKPKVFKNDEIVHIRQDARFVTVRVGPGPVE